MKLGVKALIGGGLLVCAICTAGMDMVDERPNAVLVEEVYIVKQGDTLWNICEEYVAKNTGTVRYILEYKSGIEENNPWLVDRGGVLHPGDKLTMTYWVKEEKK